MLKHTKTFYTWGVQSYPERAGVAAGFHSNQAEATPESIEIQDQLIKQVESGVAPARLE